MSCSRFVSLARSLSLSLYGLLIRQILSHRQNKIRFPGACVCHWTIRSPTRSNWPMAKFYLLFSMPESVSVSVSVNCIGWHAACTLLALPLRLQRIVCKWNSSAACPQPRLVTGRRTAWRPTSNRNVESTCTLPTRSILSHVVAFFAFVAFNKFPIIVTHWLCLHCFVAVVRGWTGDAA